MTMKSIPEALLYSIDAGNGTCKAVSNLTRGTVQFAPVIAPMTDKRALTAKDENPTFSLRVDNQILVFGIDDVFAHGKTNAIRRLNSLERYTDPDYFRILQVLFLHIFAAFRGKAAIYPTGALSLPISKFNDPKVIKEVKECVIGEHHIADAQGCELHLEIEPQKLLIMPESAGALYHYAFHPKNFERREKADLTGSSLIIDIGFETVDSSLFDGTKYRRDRAFTVPRAGVSVIVRAIQEALRKSVREVDITRIDDALRDVASTPVGQRKEIEPVEGLRIDITDVYNAEVGDLGTRIAQQVLSDYPETISRVLLAGGGAYHLEHVLRQQLDPLPVSTVPDAATANVQGIFTMLQMEAQKSR